jgi:hypothetical protein
MNPTYVQLEVLLMTGTTLTSGNLCKNEDPSEKDPLTEKELLKEACWNGLLQTMLPEICLPSADGGALYLWQIKESESFLELELGEVPVALDRRLSITPQSFFDTLCFN